MELTDNLNIVKFKPLITPEKLKANYPQTEAMADFVAKSRTIVQRILTNHDNRKIVMVGPCSLHDKDATFEYAAKLKDLQSKIKDKIVIIMRAYFEKPRTTLGWKGMIYDPYLDGSYDIEQGLNQARSILLKITELGLPVGTELLDPIVPQYLADMVSWAGIGARTTESQIHRQMASGLSMPTGFKNSTDGNLTAAIDAVRAAAGTHSFMGIDRNGQVIIAETKGNRFGHLVMRGGTNKPNYSAEYVAFAEILLKKAGISNGIIIDCSHANSGKDYRRQRVAMLNVVEQIKSGTDIIAGVMLESFLAEGNQKPKPGEPLKYGMSLTDGCIGWDETEKLVNIFADSV
ncbi:MAG: 3-deoxy-7-phosphoheptulonate synthase [Anaerohalosphaeraceae bacterium]|nr:3-deoxy-7-phosphoheptulonate synthase [Anaerohalosphaeraceae bacterium]